MPGIKVKKEKIMQKENNAVIKLVCFPGRFMAARRVGVSRFFVSPDGKKFLLDIVFFFATF